MQYCVAYSCQYGMTPPPLFPLWAFCTTLVSPGLLCSLGDPHLQGCAPERARVGVAAPQGPSVLPRLFLLMSEQYDGAGQRLLPGAINLLVQYVMQPWEDVAVLGARMLQVVPSPAPPSPEGSPPPLSLEARDAGSGKKGTRLLTQTDRGPFD